MQNLNSVLFPDSDIPKTKKQFMRPTLEEVQAYCRERKNRIDPEQWFDHYTANGWKVGRNSMADWKAAVRTWERSSFNGNGNGPAKIRDDLSPMVEIRRQQEAYKKKRGYDV